MIFLVMIDYFLRKRLFSVISFWIPNAILDFTQFSVRGKSKVKRNRPRMNNHKLKIHYERKNRLKM